MKIKVLKEFKDLKENILRKPGDIFVASKDRYREISEELSRYCSQCKWIEEVEDTSEVEETSEKDKKK